METADNHSENQPCLTTHSETAHLDMRWCGGIGDWIMATPAIAAYKRLHPGQRLIVYAKNMTEQVYRHNPAIAQVRTDVRWDHPIPCLPGEPVFSFRHAWEEGIIQNCFHALGIPGDRSDRRMHHYIAEDEKRDAWEIARHCGLDERRWIIGLQAHGSWRRKRWAHTAAFAQLAMAAGAQVLLMGTERDTDAAGVALNALSVECGRDILSPLMGAGDPGGRNASNAMSDLIDLRGRIHDETQKRAQMSLRLSLALLRLCDVAIGFDSGLPIAAIALERPTVSLWGQYDPLTLLGDVSGFTAPYRFLRARTPEQCRARFGISCRDTRGILHCPLRSSESEPISLGADCIDEIPPESVLEAASAMPRWNVGFWERFFPERSKYYLNRR